jgi:RHS repeat-associated protein
VLDDSGAVLSEQRYLPFGQVREDVGAITQTDFGYTFQRNLPDTGLMDYNARFYSQQNHRFSQPDTDVPEPGNPQALNRYSYTLNNPVRYTDPTGHWIDEGGGFATNKKKNAGLKIVSGRRVGNSDGDGIFATPPSRSEPTIPIDPTQTTEESCSTSECTSENVFEIYHAMELTAFGGFVFTLFLYAYVEVAINTGGIGLILGLPFLAISAVGLWAFFLGGQELYSAYNPEYEVDPYLLVHLFFPDAFRE